MVIMWINNSCYHLFYFLNLLKKYWLYSIFAYINLRKLQPKITPPLCKRDREVISPQNLGLKAHY